MVVGIAAAREEATALRRSSRSGGMGRPPDLLVPMAIRGAHRHARAHPIQRDPAVVDGFA